MTVEKAGRSRGFRPKGKTLVMIEDADKLGLNVSELVNAVIEKYGANVFRPAIEAKKAELQKLLTSLS
ncbi:MAG: hypothetical protein U1F65_05865 [Verrucomicrobiota bacterium]